MTPTRRRPDKSGYRPPRDRKEVLVAIAAVLGVVLVTAVLIFVLRPDNESADTPPVVTAPPTSAITPSSAPTSESSVPAESTAPPESSLPPESSVPASVTTTP
jgi:type VI secretion system secreted protein VgrG